MTFAELVETKHPRPWVRTLMHRAGDNWGWSIYVLGGDRWRRVAMRLACEGLAEDEARGELALKVLAFLPVLHSPPRS